MSLSELPKAIVAFIEAARAADIRDLLATLTTNALILDGGREHRGPAIVHWGSWSFAQPRKFIHPIKFVYKDDVAVVYIALADNKYISPKQIEWSFQMTGDKISGLTVRDMELPDLPPPVAAYIFATNLSDLDGLVSTFAENATVNDPLHEYNGLAAIRKWAARDIIAQQLVIFTIRVLHRPDDTTVVAHIDGNFEKDGLPDPLVMTLIFSVANHKIIRLTILDNEFVP